MDKLPLRLRKLELQQRSALLRASITQEAQLVQKPIKLIDSVHRLVNSVVQHPLPIGMGLAALTITKPRWAKRVAGMLWSAYFYWRRLR